MSLGGILKTIGKGIIGLVPGGGTIVSGLEMAGAVAEAVGGETGKQIADGARMMADGLDKAGQQPMTPELQVRLREAGMRHDERMAELGIEADKVNLADVEGGRDLAKSEIASDDEYVRRTRPKLLRWVAAGYLILCGLALPLVVIAAVWGDLDDAAANLLVYVVCTLIGAVGTMLATMYRTYTGKRSAEKMASLGIQPEGILDKLVKLKTGGKD